ncbi:hypothetical protein FACS189499_04770 [Clostridia bacterium]|nr:hypothetical protein FACS189499_04770 [Clostridia bacterium]
MEKIKHFWEEHKTKIIIVGGVILTAATIVILKCRNNQGTNIVDGYADCTKEKVLDFIKGADDDLEYAIFKECGFFNVEYL